MPHVLRLTRYGSWAFMEYTGQPVASAPKYLALLDVARDSAPNALPVDTSSACVTVDQLGSFVPTGLHPEVCLFAPKEEEGGGGAAYSWGA